MEYSRWRDPPDGQIDDRTIVYSSAVAWFVVELTKQDESIFMPPLVCISSQILFTTDVRVTMQDNIVATNAGYPMVIAAVMWYVPIPQTMVIRLSRRLNHCLSIIRQHRNVTAVDSIGS